MLAQNEQILIVDDDCDVLQAYDTLLTQQGFCVRTCHDPLQVCAMIPVDWAGIVLTDIYMPYLSGMELLNQIHKADPHLPVLLITGHGDVPMAVNAVKKGAYDFFEKPINPELFIDKIKHALQDRVHYIDKKIAKKNQITLSILGESSWSKKLRDKLLALALVDIPIYIYGEKGTGRLLAAKQLHDFKNAQSPLVIINLAIESEHVLLSKIEQSENGTLIIQNIEKLSVENQDRLAQLQSSAPRKFRLVVISHQPADTLTKTQRFLPEFYYLFSLTQIECIPLNRRRQDIEILFKYYLNLACKKLNIKRPKLSDLFLKKLIEHKWNNNISELVNAAELCAVDISPLETLTPSAISNQHSSLDDQIDKYEKQIITRALEKYQGKINEAANYLQIPRKKLYLRMKKYQLDKKEYRF